MLQAGFNHNIRYKNVLFHVQTEDYGQQKHQIVTQLFYRGTLVFKIQTDYSEFQGLDDVSAQIQEMMKMQHVKMLKDLVNHKISVPSWIFDQAINDAENSKPVLNLDQETKKDTFEKSIAEFLEKKT